MGDFADEQVEPRDYWDHREARWVRPTRVEPVVPVVPAQPSAEDGLPAVASAPEVDVRSG